MYCLTGDKKYLAKAQHSADSSMAYYCQDDRLWKQAPAFNAIYLRNLLQLDAAAPDPDYHHLVNGYADRVWHDSLNPESGLFNGKPSQAMGNYGGKSGDISTLDQAALVQIFSIQGWAPAWREQLT